LAVSFFKDMHKAFLLLLAPILVAAAVVVPNSSSLDYSLFLNRFLFQSESGSLTVPLDSAKSSEQDPQLVIGDHLVSFRKPDDVHSFPGKRIAIESSAVQSRHHRLFSRVVLQFPPSPDARDTGHVSGR